MDIARIARHLFTGRRSARLAFPPATLLAIEQAITQSETMHGGEIRFAVEAALDGAPLFHGQSARARAIDVFSELRVWDTERNNGLLIYVLVADHAVEIVADRGIHAHVGAPEWESICSEMEAAFKRADFEGGMVRGVRAVTQHLARHFPAGTDVGNELPDKPVVL